MAAKKRTTIGSTKDPATDFRWEDASFDDAHAAFTRWADHVRDRPDFIDRRKRNLLYASLYSNLPLLGFGVNSYTRNIPHQGRIAVNATQNAIDSLVSKLCKNRPRPMFETVGGDYELSEACEDADAYIDARFDELDYYTEVHPGRVLDMAVYGLGVTKSHIVDGEGIVERIFPWEMIFDGRECLYGKPIRQAQRTYYDKQEAFDRWKKAGNGRAEKDWNRDLEDTLSSQSVESDRQDFDRDETSDQVIVYEGYTIRKNSPGKRIVCVRGKTLEYDEHKDKISPYTYTRPEVQTMGMWGIGICERVAGIQGEINRIVRDIQMAMHLIAKPHWMIEASSMVTPAMLNNDIATIIKYSGSVPPQVYTPQSMSAEVFQHLQYLIKTLYEITGISQLSAQSQKPAGLSSALALRTYQNVETERFNDFQRAIEEAAAKDAWKLARLVGREKGKREVNAAPTKGTRLGRKVKWSGLDMEDSRTRVQPASKLPDTPAGRRDYALELAQYTQVTTDDIYEMLEWDDTEAFARRRLAGKRNVERDIMKLRRGDKVVRDAIGDHMMAFKMMTDAYEQAKHDMLPEKRLGPMREYIKACYKYLTGKAWVPNGPNPLPGQPAPAPMGAPGQMMPPGMPPPPMGPLPNGGAPMPPGMPPPGAPPGVAA
jgi:hypothetical protein